MEIMNNLYFAAPNLLWFAIVAPLVSILYLFTKNKLFAKSAIYNLADANLLPHLISNSTSHKSKNKLALLLFNLIWILSVIALAGPRWGLIQVPSFKSSSSLIIVLDMSSSMAEDDVKPDRLERAKQEILDINANVQVVNIGVIGFAKYPHIIIPLTEDRELIKTIIPALDTRFIKFQGKEANLAITQAIQQLDNTTNHDKSILLITDGRLTNDSILTISKQINNADINLFVLGVGNKIDQEPLKKLAASTKGVYKLYDSTQEMYKLINKKLFFRHSKDAQAQEMITIWHERFYWFLAPAMILFLLYILAVKQELLLLIIFFAMAYPKTSYAIEFKDYFKNKEEIALEQYKESDYVQSKNNFTDPYRQGVAAYRAGLYNEAEQAFKNSKRLEVAISALYNLGNSLALQDKLQEAVASYEMVLQSQPDHKDAQENLKIVKDLLEQKKEKDHEQTKEQDQSKDNKQEQDKSQDKDPNREQDKNTENNQTSDQSKEDQVKPEQDTQQSPSKEVSSVKQDEKSAEEIKADKWLNQLDNDLKAFLHNKFYIEEHMARRGDY